MASTEGLFRNLLVVCIFSLLARLHGCTQTFEGVVTKAGNT